MAVKPTSSWQQKSGIAPRWLHLWALATVGAAFVLLLLGSVVTTFRVGMADPVWPTYPWHLLLVSWEEPKPGFLVEHSHRLAGYIVGCLTIVLAFGLWLKEPRRWVRWLGLTALAGVTAQGLLGGFRVRLHHWLGTDLAFLHGCFAQLVFSALVILAVVTSRAWIAPSAHAISAGLRRWSLAVVGLVYLQIVFGAVVRHTSSYEMLMWGRRTHLAVAFLVTAAVVWLTRGIFERRPGDKSLPRLACILFGLVAGQVLLGIEAWMLPLTGSGATQQAVVRTTHVLVGTLILATAVTLALKAQRLQVAEFPSASVSIGPQEEAA